MLLHTKYQSSRPSGFRLDESLGFRYVNLCKTCDTWVGPFWPQGYNLNSFVGFYLMILHTKYQGSRHCGFIPEDFFRFSP